MNLPYDLGALALLGAGAAWLYDKPHFLFHGFFRADCAKCIRKRARAEQRTRDRAIAAFNRDPRRRAR